MGKKVLVGMLLLGALIIFALATFYIENWERYITKGYEITCRFETAQSLQVGDEVRIAGVKVGRVNALSVETEKPADRPVTAALWIRPDIKVRAEDVAHVETLSVFGGSFISISRKDPDARELKDGDELENTDIRPSITQLIATADATLEEASRVFVETRGTLAKAGTAFDGAGETLQNLQEITDRIEKGEGFIWKLLTDDKGYDELQAAIGSAQNAFEGFEQLSTDLRGGEGFIGKLLTEEKGYDELQAAIESAQNAFEGLEQLSTDLREGKGLIPKLISDEDLARKVDEIATDAQAFIASMSKLSDNLEGSTIGKLMSTDEAHQKLVETLDEVKKSAEAINKPTGTIGKLMTDDTLHRKLVAAVESVQQLLDEYREQSPVLTFMSAIFGAF